MKRDKYDSIVSDIVRLRTNFSCEKCQYIDPEGQAKHKSKLIQASHFRGRGTGLVARFSLDNVRALCASCHSWLENRPDEHAKFMSELLGEAGFEIIRDKCNQVKKLAKADKKEMYEHYKGERDRLVKLRRAGKMGYIEVTDYF